MNKQPGGKGYIQGGKGVFITTTGDRYDYQDGELTQQTKYLGTFELQPLYDSHQSFHGKALVERYAADGDTRLVLKSYGTVVAVVTPVGTTDADTEAYTVGIALRHLSATTLRHVKEFLAQTDDAFKGITLPWLRKTIKDGRLVDGAESAWRKVYALNEL